MSANDTCILMDRNTRIAFCIWRRKNMGQNKLNGEVTAFLDNLKHSLREEIEYLRKIIMSTDYELTEGIKWNGPNYSINGEDRITIRINPQKHLQVIFHRGAKVKEQPKERLQRSQQNQDHAAFRRRVRTPFSPPCVAQRIHENSTLRIACQPRKRRAFGIMQRFAEGNRTHGSYSRIPQVQS
jgi:hypothetical protein